MDAAIWPKVHGAAVHFPLALAMVSGACDFASLGLGQRPIARDLQTVGHWTMVLGALGSVVAVTSGLLLTHGRLLGHGALRMHHLFVWPAFGLLIALATWRVISPRPVPRRDRFIYLSGVGTLTALMTGAGYWGGELLIN
jgi:uncharacterized membrane protein